MREVHSVYRQQKKREVRRDGGREEARGEERGLSPREGGIEEEREEGQRDRDLRRIYVDTHTHTDIYIYIYICKRRIYVHWAMYIYLSVPSADAHERDPARPPRPHSSP
jgi:hypothetical protein